VSAAVSPRTIRPAARGAPALRVVATAGATVAVITSAGLALAATFTVPTALPVVTALQIGLIVAIGVLLDMFVVRSRLVPALATDAGPRIRWQAVPTTGPAFPEPTRS